MVAQLRAAVGRFKKLEVLYIVVCLCLQFISDVSAVDSVPKNVQSSSNLKGSIHNMPNKSAMQKNFETNEKLQARKSRATQEVDLSSMFYEDGKEPETINEFPYLRDENSEITSERISKRNAIIPFPRPGRSKVDPNLIMPYPDSWLMPYLPKTLNEMNEVSTPVLDDEEEFRNSEYLSEEEDKENSITYEEVISPGDDEFQFDSITERQADSNGTVIPYPRLGKRNINLSEKDAPKFNQNTSARVRRTTDSMIPQIRYGRSTEPNKLSKSKQSLYILPNYRPGRSSNDIGKYFKYDKSSKPGILPYPRPGRSDGESVKRQTYILPQPRFGRSLIGNKDYERINMILKSNPPKPDKLTGELFQPEESQLFLIPYPRPGKRFFGTKPLPPNVNLQTKDKEYVSDEDTADKEEAVATFLVPYPRPGRSESDKQYLIPNVRFGKATSDSVLPLPRYGRSVKKNNILPYPRPGRSETLLPQARFGRSNILPYPRPGRSSLSVLHYPRLKRSSSSVLPYPRLGRSSSSVLPYPRLGRASSFTSVIPQLRVGKSSSFMIPQMRVGKSSSFMIPQMRVGKSSSFMIPQMRVGKAVSSGSIIPQLRVGKSSNSLLSLLEDETNELLLHGMSEDNDLNLSDEEAQQLQKPSSEPSNFQTHSEDLLKSTVLIPAKKLQKHMLTFESNYMLPYPRPGRFV